MLASYEDENSLTVALVYRGTAENAKKFLDKQDEYFANHEPGDGEEGDAGEKAEGGDDPVKRANDIINGNADYYDVEEAVDNG